MISRLLSVAVCLYVTSTIGVAADPAPPLPWEDTAPAGYTASGDQTARPCCGRDVCCAKVEKVTEEKSCWTVKCEKICVPSITLPWEKGGSGLTIFSCLKKKKCCKSGSGCGESVDCCSGCFEGCCPRPKCGRVKCVAVLDSKDYEVTRCECKWEIWRLPSCGCDSCGCTSCVCDKSSKVREKQTMVSSHVDNKSLIARGPMMRREYVRTAPHASNHHVAQSNQQEVQQAAHTK